MRKERESSSSTKQSSNDSEINKIRDELNKNKVTLTEVESKLEVTNKTKRMSDEKLKKLENDFKKDKLALEKKSGGLEIDLQVSKDGLLVYLKLESNCHFIFRTRGRRLKL